MDININELWLCKTSYIEANNNEINCKEAYTVVVVMEPEDLNGEEFIRVQPVSKQIAFRSEEDILVSDESILGYPFIIETWNEQPILTKILDKKLGSIPEVSSNINEQEEYTEEQLTFRKDEIKRTAFLRQSVLSQLASSESSSEYGKKKTISRTIQFMSYAAIIIGVVFMLWQPQKLSREEFIAQYQVIKPIELLDDYPDNSLRGEGVRIAGFSEEESVIIQLAIKKYIKEDFSGASILFAKVPDLLNKNSELCFYSALSNLYDDNTSNAIKLFEGLRGISSFKYESDVLYYLALTYVKEGEEANAREILKELHTLDPNYLKDKPNMIKELRWF